jgi:hypothetical protein
MFVIGKPMDIIYADKPVTEVKCYGGPAHGRVVNVSEMATNRIEMLVEPRVDLARYEEYPPHLVDALLMRPRIETNTYYLQMYAQEGITECRSGVFRQLKVAVVDGADLTVREKYELERGMESIPWRWKTAPSILSQFGAWWEKELHDCGWEQARIYYQSQENSDA